VWSFNYFFYNKKLKRILYLSCRAVTKAAAEEVRRAARARAACRAPARACGHSQPRRSLREGCSSAPSGRR
jgi:hypothetical protein